MFFPDNHVFTRIGVNGNHTYLRGHIQGGGVGVDSPANVPDPAGILTFVGNINTVQFQLGQFFTRDGIPFKQLIRQGLLTPSCGLALLATKEAAARAL